MTKNKSISHPVAAPEIVPEDVAEEVDGGRHQPGHQAIFPGIVVSRANKRLNLREKEELLLSKMRTERNEILVQAGALSMSIREHYDKNQDKIETKASCLAP